MLYDAFYFLNSSIVQKYDGNYQHIPEKGILVAPKSPGYPLWGTVDSEIYGRPLCKSCQEEGIERSWMNPTSGFISIFGISRAEYFIPTGEMAYSVVTQQLVDALAKTPFSGYCLFPLKTYYEHHETSEIVIPPLYGLYGTGNDYDTKAYRDFLFKNPEYCIKCHWFPKTCPECEGEVMVCPQCGGTEFTSDSDVVFTFPYKEIDYPEIDYCQPICCRFWDGSDFLSRPGSVISGRVAKWLVENQYGPFFLQPYPADDTECTDEQIKRIENIRYRNAPVK